MADIDGEDEVSRAIAQITAAVTNVGLYSLSHPQVGQYIEKAYAALTEALSARPELTVLLIGDDVIAGNRPLPASAAYAANFGRILRRKGVERLTFLAGLEREELRGLIEDLSAADAGVVRSHARIKLGKVGVRVRREPGTAMPGKEEPAHLDNDEQELIKELRTLTTKEMEELQELYHRIKQHRQINVRGVEDVVRRFISGFRQDFNPMSILASLKSANEYTFTHVTNVGILSITQAQGLGFHGDELHKIGVASLLHDAGKLFIPDEILSKPGKLTNEERKVIETHTVKGARYLMGLDGIPKLAVLAALEHHIKFDGGGYPTVKTGWRPNIVSQIICVSDVFDAMRSKRAYQGAIPVEKIREVLTNGRGSSFNPLLVDRFMKMVQL